MQPLLVVLGSTASGKEAAAVHAAPLLSAEIVLCDSAKPYRGIEIASAAPRPEHRAAVPHHLAGVLDPRERLNAAHWVELAEAAFADILARGRRPLVVGGTALYLRALLHGLFEGPRADPARRSALREEEEASPGALHARLALVDPVAAARLHPHDTKRLLRAVEVFEATGRPISDLQREWTGPPRRAYRAVGIRRTREDLRRRIDARVDRMVAEGLLDEVRRLVREDALGPTAAELIGVKELVPVVRDETATGRLDDARWAQALVEVRRHTWSLARRQATWWKRFPDATWLDVPSDEPPHTTGERIAAALGGPE